MTIVKYKNQSGITYAYESVSEWDPVRKQSRPKRKYLGRVDPETGEIISTKGKRGRPKKDPDAPPPEGNDYKQMYQACSAALKTLENQVKSLEAEIRALSLQNQKLTGILASIHQITVDSLK